MQDNLELRTKDQNIGYGGHIVLKTKILIKILRKYRISMKTIPKFWIKIVESTQNVLKVKY